MRQLLFLHLSAIFRETRREVCSVSGLECVSPGDFCAFKGGRTFAGSHFDGSKAVSLILAIDLMC